MLPLDPATGPAGSEGSQRAPQPVPTQAMPPQAMPPQAMPPQAVAHGGTFVRPGALAWGEAPGTAGPAGVAPPPPPEIVEKALAAVAEDPDGTSALFDELSRAHVWVPLPAGDQPVTDGSAVELPTVTYLGTEFVPCFTSARRLADWAAGQRGHVWQRPAENRMTPHIVVPAAALAWRLPPGLGMALNPGAEASVPIHPEGVAYLAASHGSSVRAADAADVQVLIGHPPDEPAALLRAVRDGLRHLPAVREAARAWLSVPGEGEGLIISVTLEDPASTSAQAAVLGTIEHAVAAVPRPAFPIDVTFPGEAAPDIVDTWIAEHACPFYTRD